MRVHAVIAALAAIVLALPVAAEVTAQVQRTQVVENETFRISITVEGENVSQPQPPKVSGIEINPEPVEQRAVTSFRFGGSGAGKSQRHDYVFEAHATEAGRVEVPPFTVLVDGVEETTEPFVMTVKEDTARVGAGQGPPRPGRGQAQRNDPAANQLQIQDTVLLEATVDKQEVYQGEAVTLTLQIWEYEGQGVSTHYSGGRTLPMPDTSGFYQGPTQDNDYRRERDGHPYVVREFQRVLYPTGTGEFTIGAWHWRGEVHAFTTRGQIHRTITKTTEPIDVVVKPLPAPPPEFSGAVGSFDVKAGLLESSVVQAVPTQLLVRVIGRGNPAAIRAPHLPEIPWAQVSEPQSEVVEPPGGDWRTIEKRFIYDIVPRETGALEIPAFGFTYFSPEEEAYQTEQVDAFRVQVRPSTVSTELVTAGGAAQRDQQGVQILGEGMLGIQTEAELTSAASNALWYAGGYAAPPVLYGLFFLLVRHRRRLAGDVGYARAYYARNTATKRLQAVESAPDPAEALHHAVADYLSDRLNANTGGFTAQEAAQAIEERGVQSQASDSLVKILRNCERRRYSGQELSADEVHALKQAALSAIEDFEKQFRKGNSV